MTFRLVFIYGNEIFFSVYFPFLFLYLLGNKQISTQVVILHTMLRSERRPANQISPLMLVFAGISVNRHSRFGYQWKRGPIWEHTFIDVLAEQND